MLNRNILWIYPIFILLASFISPRHAVPIGVTKRWVISENSSLCVNGSTNINKFACDIPTYDQTDTLTVIKGKGGKEVVLSGTIGLKVQSFDCHNSIMTRDLRKTLKEKEFPRL